MGVRFIFSKTDWPVWVLTDISQIWSSRFSSIFIKFSLLGSVFVLKEGYFSVGNESIRFFYPFIKGVILLKKKGIYHP